MLDRASPIKSVIIKEQNVPWINIQLVSLRKKRNRARITAFEKLTKKRVLYLILEI